MSSENMRSAKTESNWNVSEKHLPSVPGNYHLEYSSIFIAHAHANEIAERISKFLTAHSIAAIFHDQEVLVEAATHDGVEFLIRLFKGTNGGVDGVIMEVRRLDGSTVLFFNYCRWMYETARGETSLLDEEVTFTTMFVPPILTEVHNDLNEETRINASLNSVLDMLNTDTMSSFSIGLQMLCWITDLDKVNTKLALLASEAVIFGNTSCGLKIHEKIFHLIGRTKTHYFIEASCDSFDSQQIISNLVDELRTLAYKALCKCLITMTRMRKKTLRTTKCVWLWKHLVNIFINELRGMETHPHLAMYSLKGLALIADISEEARKFALNQDVICLMMKAQKYGKGCYVSLAIESESALCSFTNLT